MTHKAENIDDKKEFKKEKVKITYNKSLFYLIILVAILLVVTLLIISFNQSDSDGQENNLPVGNSCSSDSDCVKMLSTCCPCNSGGRYQCANEEGYIYIKKILANCTNENLVCPMSYNCDNSQCLCIDGKCKLG